MRLISRLRSGLAALQPAEFALSMCRCPFCGPSLFVRLNADDSGLRCTRCTASAIHLLIGTVLGEQLPDLSALDVCELSARGPFVNALRKRSRSLCVSEYFEGLPSGSKRGDVRCEDVQNLSYADASFDLVTHTEVLEHVPDDRRALAELRRVLRPGGHMIFTVPLYGGERTIERARLRDGRIEHLLKPVYHTDPVRGNAGILAFRDYGHDIAERLQAAGFDEVVFSLPQHRIPWLQPRPVIVARVRG